MIPKDTEALSRLTKTPAACRQQSPAAARQKPLLRGGFTLIEMLVVVIIIAVLAGMVLGLMKVSGYWTAKTVTNKNLGKVRAAIEEFYAEYGKYPPVQPLNGIQPFYYEYPTSNGMNSAAETYVLSPAGSSSPVFTFGLMSFLVTRYAGHADSIIINPNVNLQWPNLFNSCSQWTANNAGGANRWDDQARDKAAVQRWIANIADIQTVTTVARGMYTNAYLTVQDGWGKDLHYESPPPNQSYKLYAIAPDGTIISTGAGW